MRAFFSWGSAFGVGTGRTVKHYDARSKVLLQANRPGEPNTQRKPGGGPDGLFAVPGQALRTTFAPPQGFSSPRPSVSVTCCLAAA